MDIPRIQAQNHLIEEFKRRNPELVESVSQEPDWTKIRVRLRNVPFVVRGRGGPERRTSMTLTFSFDERYPAFPPRFEVDPRPISSHVWENATICILQPAWFPGRVLVTAIVDFVEMIQGGEQVEGGGANGTDAAWLRDAGNLRRLRDLVGRPTRFLLPGAGAGAPSAGGVRPVAPVTSSAGGVRAISAARPSTGAVRAVTPAGVATPATPPSAASVRVIRR